MLCSKLVSNVSSFFAFPPKLFVLDDSWYKSVLIELMETKCLNETLAI